MRDSDKPHIIKEISISIVKGDLLRLGVKLNFIVCEAEALYADCDLIIRRGRESFSVKVKTVSFTADGYTVINRPGNFRFDILALVWEDEILYMFFEKKKRRKRSG